MTFLTWILPVLRPAQKSSQASRSKHGLHLCAAAPTTTEPEDASFGQISTINAPRVPVLDALARERDRVRANFFCPGHKQGETVHSKLRDLLGARALKADLPELPALGNLFASEGVLDEGQQLAADAFMEGGREQWKTHFLVNGSTSGVEAALLACTTKNGGVILPRDAHQSAVHGLVLSGATPVWVEPVYDVQLDLSCGITAKAVEDALRTYPGRVDAVFVVSPTYQGIISDIAAIAKVTHAYGAHLIVDEAHGAHLPFHPELPVDAARLGADVVLHSVHKTLPAMTQSAIMHVRRHSGVDDTRVRAALRLVQSSSPNYILLASLDAARALMQEEGRALLTRTIALARLCAKRIARLDGFSVLNLTSFDEPNMTNRASIYAHDPTRVTVLLPSHVSGYDVDEILIDRFGVYAELPSFRHITFIFTPGTTEEDVDRLVTSLTVYAATTPIPKTKSGIHPGLPMFSPVQYTMRMTPRQAFFAPSQSVPAAKAIGCISAETLCPYPPGIPVLLPGEIVTQHGIQLLKTVLDAGGSVSGASDNTLSTIRVIDETATNLE